MTKAWLINKQAVIAMIVTYIVSLVVLFEQAQWWVLVLGMLCVAWRGAMLLGKASFMKSSWRFIITLLTVTLLAITAKQVGLLDTMINLLLLGYGLKFIELNKRRDAFVLPLVGILCISVMFIFDSDMASALLGAALLVGNLAVLISVCAPSLASKQQLALSLRIVGLSLPLTMVLFIVMPQLAPLWKMPAAKAATTGLADSMSPGDIARLGQDDRLAFSVTFDEDIPARDQLYWRALVMENFDGRRWQQSPAIQRWQDNQMLAYNWLARAALDSKTAISYQVMAKASNQSWLFGLAVPTSPDAGVVQTPNQNIRSTKLIASAKAYRVVSYPHVMSQLTLSSRQRQNNLQVPTESNLATKVWVNNLRAKYSDQQLIDFVLAHFHNNPYRYTLTPPPLGDNSVDEFLFETQQGFCAHYASAFALIMRYAGIPSRVVGGYLGGEWNENVGYLNVYQYDAHAWNEVWLEGKGWVRVDPTASVAPERVEQGLAQALDNQQSFLAGTTLSLAKYRQIPWVNALRVVLANAEYQWSRWLLGYNQDRQNQLLTNLLGQLTMVKISVFILACFTIIGAWLLYAGGFRVRRLNPMQKIDKQYFLIVLALEEKGVKRQSHFTPNRYRQLVSQKFPLLHHDMTEVTSHYNRLRFAREEVITHQDVKAFKSACQRLLNKI